MLNKVVIAGLLGGLTLVLWSLLINGILGFKSQLDMKQVPNERQVYELLKLEIIEPGRYICNPELTSSNIFPENEPVFSILYGGMGHETAGSQSVFELILAFMATIIGAWMLSLTSDKIISSYPRKVFFFSLIGLLIAIFSDLKNYGIGNYPLTDTLYFAFHSVIVWTVVGFVMARFIKPRYSN